MFLFHIEYVLVAHFVVTDALTFTCFARTHTRTRNRFTYIHIFCTHTHTHTHTHTCVCQVLKHSSVLPCYKFAYICTRTYICVHVFSLSRSLSIPLNLHGISTCINWCIYIYIYIYMHAHIHVCTCMLTLKVLEHSS